MEAGDNSQDECLAELGRCSRCNRPAHQLSARTGQKPCKTAVSSRTPDVRHFSALKFEEPARFKIDQTSIRGTSWGYQPVFADYFG